MENIRNLRIGDILIEYGYVSQEQIEDALAYQKEHAGTRMGAALVALGYIGEQQMLMALGERLQIPLVDLTEETIDSAAVQKIPRLLAEKYEMLALSESGGVLKVAVNDPLNFYGIEDVRQLTGKNIALTLAPQKPLHHEIMVQYAEIEARRAAEAANVDFRDVEELAVLEEDEEDDAPIIHLLNRLIHRAYSTNTSDIHIEPFEKSTSVRMRIDGVIVDYVTLEKKLHGSLIARIKILGDMDIAERRLPQDGHFRTRVEGGEYVNIRVSVIPTVYGEKAVLRLLANNAQIDDEKTLGMRRENYDLVNRMLAAPHGIIYFTGPTGSGKTTTLYMILEKLSGRQLNISTIEDPVEKNIPRINQMQVNTQAGLTFEKGLRALLRQDPDVIMVGETRDAETAAISVRSAITGHLVFSTLHTNDAVSAIPRLLDMGLLPYMVAESLVGVVAQRLMRKVCSECGAQVEASEEEANALGCPGKKLLLRKGKGCSACNHTGYRGRIAIHELFFADRPVKDMIAKGASTDEIRDYCAKTQGMRSLKEQGRELVLSGVTTVEELKKVAYHV